MYFSGTKCHDVKSDARFVYLAYKWYGFHDWSRGGGLDPALSFPKKPKLN